MDDLRIVEIARGGIMRHDRDLAFPRRPAGRDVSCHALELSGKMRLAREQYLAVQPIYIRASATPESPSRS
jgi:hypothetical protein